MDADTKILLQELDKIQKVADGLIYVVKKTGGAVADGQYLRTIKDLRKLASDAMKKVKTDDVV